MAFAAVVAGAIRTRRNIVWVAWKARCSGAIDELDIDKREGEESKRTIVPVYLVFGHCATAKAAW